MPITVERARGLLLFTGALLLLAALLTGLPFAMAIRYEWGADAVRAWRVAHTSLLTGGLLNVAVGAAVDRLVLRPVVLRVLAWSLVVMACALLVVVPVGAVTGERGLVLGESVVGTLVALGFLVMGAAVFTGVVVLLVGAAAALRAASGGDRRG